MNSPTLDRAIATARRAHEGQIDKGGLPYIEHPLAVMEAVRPYGEDAMIVAVLHDVVEDTPVTLEDLAWIGGHRLAAVAAMTREPRDDPDRETYREYVCRLSANPLARIVKRADVEHNASPERSAALEPGEAAGLKKRYEWTLKFLSRP